MTVADLQNELRARHALPYRWGQTQNDAFDGRTQFVYEVKTWPSLLACLSRFEAEPSYELLRDYAANRWYNFWSARAVEHFFSESPRVQPAANSRDRLRDFSFDGIAFDHKTSVWPAAYGGAYAAARLDSAPLIQWLYANQSRQGRQHFENRLFVVLHRADGAHWKLKADLTRLRAAVKEIARFMFHESGLDRCEGAVQPVAVPGLDLLLRGGELGLEVVEDLEVVGRMGFGGDGIGELAHGEAVLDGFGQQPRLTIGFVEPLELRHRLRAGAPVGLEQRDRAERIARQIGRVALFAFGQADRHVVVGEALEVERDPQPIAGRAAEEALKPHQIANPLKTQVTR